MTREEDIALVKANSSQDESHVIGPIPLAAFMDLIHIKLIYMS